MASAYWTAAIREDVRHKTIFMTPHDLSEMCVPAHGLCNSQATYQQIDEVNKNIDETESLSNDVTTFTKTFDEMLAVLRKLFTALRGANLQLQMSVCLATLK